MREDGSKRCERARKFNKHHLTPRSRGGKSNPSNIMRFDISRHNAWHFLFGNRTLEEVIQLLKRLKHLKNRR